MQMQIHTLIHTYIHTYSEPNLVASTAEDSFDNTWNNTCKISDTSLYRYIHNMNTTHSGQNVLCMYVCTTYPRAAGSPPSRRVTMQPYTVGPSLGSPVSGNADNNTGRT